MSTRYAPKIKILVAAAVLAISATPISQAAQGGANVDYVSGGVGLGARASMQSQVQQYNLHVEFTAAPEGEYLSDVDVSVSDGRGANVLTTRTDGPWLLARLPAGNYTLKATYGGTIRTQQVSVGAGRRHIVMRFPQLNEHMAGNDSR